MTLGLMIYGTVVGVLLAGSSHFLDRGLRAVGRPTRLIWVLGMAAVAGAPILSHPVLREVPPQTGRGSSIPAQLLYEVLARATPPPRGAWSLSAGLDRPLLFCWALSTILLLGLALVTTLRLRRRTTGWEPRKLGSDEVLVSEGLGPAVLGVIRPTIVLPPWALALGREKLEMVLLHEREHQVARDPALLSAGLLLTAVTPWNPALWWMFSRLHLSVEGDCDRRVLSRGVPARAYGDLLLEVAAGSRGLSALVPALAEGGRTLLERRLLMIRSTVRKHRFGSAAVAGLAGAALLFLACETPTPPARQEGPDASTVVLRKRAPSSPTSAELQPLIYVDGVRLTGTETIQDIDPEGIEKIEVIKGKAAVAQYGEEASRGVILITTKRKATKR